MTKCVGVFETVLHYFLYTMLRTTRCGWNFYVIIGDSAKIAMTGGARLIRSLSSARFSFELSGNLN